MAGVINPFDWEKLSPEERVRQCREFAAQAVAQAEGKPAGSREPYLRLAAEWLQLAKEIDENRAGPTLPG